MLRLLSSAPLSAKLGLAVIALNVLAALLAPWLAPHGQAELGGEVWAPASLEHPLGTDQLGRDLLSRLLYGARLTIGIAAATTLISFAIGGTLGFAAGVLGGWVDQLLSRAVDVLMAIPTLIFALLILAILGTSIPVLILVIAVLDSTRVFRLARSLAVNVAAQDFVEVARLRGERLPWVLAREILPNAAPPLVAEFGLRFCFVFLFISALSFLGLGVQPPNADWGGMVRENAQAINFGLTAPLIPAAAIAILTIAVNLVADWLLAERHRAAGGGR
jgi:peptide/nickel transport system permease protein